jgi:hypothetical protein
MPDERGKEKPNGDPAGNLPTFQRKTIQSLSPPDPVSGLGQWVAASLRADKLSFRLAQRHPPASPALFKAGRTTTVSPSLSGSSLGTPNERQFPSKSFNHSKQLKLRVIATYNQSLTGVLLFSSIHCVVPEITGFGPPPTHSLQLYNH